MKIKQFSHGQSNPTYFLTDDNGKRYVLRKKPPGQLISKTAHAVEREYRIIKAVGENSDVPVPKVYCLCEDNDVVGTPFYIMEFLDGRIFTNLRLPELSPEERRLCWKSIIDTIVKLHSIDYKKIGLGDYGRAGGFYSRQIKSLGTVSKAQAAVKDEESGEVVGEIPELERLLDWFKRNQVSDQTTIVHGDYKMDNVVFHKTEPRVIGVLDWELSTIGHPYSDLGNLFQHYYLPPWGEDTSMVGLKGLPESEIPGPPVEQLMRWYCEGRGLEYPIKNWMFCVSFSFFRLSVILQGIAARVARKQASSASAKRHSMMFEPLGYLALEIADQGDLTEDKAKL